MLPKNKGFGVKSLIVLQKRWLISTPFKSGKIKATKLPTGRYDYVEKKANQGFNS